MSNSATAPAERLAWAPRPALFTARDLILVIFRYRRRALLAMGLGIAIAVGISLWMRPVYESSASLLIDKYGRGFSYRPDMGAARLIPVASDPEEIVNTQVQLLLSRDVILETINQVGLSNLFPTLANGAAPPDFDRAVRRFSAALSIVPQRTSNILHLSFEHPDGEVARRTLETLIRVFQDKSLVTYLNSQTLFYENEVVRQRQVFEQSAAKLNDFRRTHGAEAFDRQMALLLQQRVNLDTAGRQAAADLAGAQDRIVELRRQIGSIEPNVTAYVDREQSRVVDDARIKLLNLRLREKELRATFAPGSREVEQIEQEIGIASGFLAAEGPRFAGTVRTARNETLVQADRDLSRTLAESAAMTGRTSAIQSAIAEIDRRITAMSGSEAERWSLERDVTTAQDTLKALLTKLEEARGSDAMNRGRIGNISMVQSPSLPDVREPVRPRLLLNLILGVVAGLFGALVTALLSEFLSDTIYDTSRTERLLDIPTLAVFNLKRERSFS